MDKRSIQMSVSLLTDPEFDLIRFLDRQGLIKDETVMFIHPEHEALREYYESEYRKLK